MAKKSKNTPETKEVESTDIQTVEEKRPTVLTPRQALFCQFYFDHQSPTWGNARQSALKAGFDEAYANRITYDQPQWFSDFLRNNTLIDKIERHFTEIMSMPNITQAMGAFGPIEKTKVVVEETGEVYKTGAKKGQPKTRKVKIKVPVYVPNVALIKAKNEVAKIAAPAHDPDRYGRKQSGTNNFIFNMAADRQRFA